MRRRSVLFAVLPVVALAFVARQLLITQAHATAQLPTLIEGPDVWIPFASDVAVYHPGSRTTLGHFFRSSNGSTRLETGSDDGQIKAVQIKNIVESRHFLLNAQGTWRSGRLILPTEGYRPTRMKATMPGLSKYPYKLALAAGQDGSLQATIGFDAYQHVDQNGTVSFHLPELNCFQAIVQFSQGARTVFSNIQIGEPDDVLFHPPPGAFVVDTLPPSGLVFEKKGM